MTAQADLTPRAQGGRGVVVPLSLDAECEIDCYTDEFAVGRAPTRRLPPPLPLGSRAQHPSVNRPATSRSTMPLPR
jgi:hypothetical protein